MTLPPDYPPSPMASQDYLLSRQAELLAKDLQEQLNLALANNRRLELRFRNVLNCTSGEAYWHVMIQQARQEAALALAGK